MTDRDLFAGASWRQRAGGSASGRLSVGPAGRSWWDRVRWYVAGVLGENAYQAYLAHHERTGCGTPPLSERDYWRSRTDWQERNPQGRCC